MHGSFKTQVNPATPVSAPAASEEVREAVRVLGTARLDLIESISNRARYADKSGIVSGLVDILNRIARNPDASQADRICAGRAVGLPSSVYERPSSADEPTNPSVLADAALAEEVHAR